VYYISPAPLVLVVKMMVVRLSYLLAILSVVTGFVSPHSNPRSFGVTTLAATKSETMPVVKVGDKIPAVTVLEGLGDFEKQDVNIAELIAGKKVVIFGVPGAFTPGCSKSHLPSFMEAQADLKAKGVDMIICIATNDVYVMEAWGRESGGADAGVKFLSDSNAELTKALGLIMETPMMPRTKRFSLLVEDGVVTHYFSSAEQASDTWAPAVLAKL
jgi:peroxiredoxin